jgi:hypothetical protein
MRYQEKFAGIQNDRENVDFEPFFRHDSSAPQENIVRGTAAGGGGMLKNSRIASFAAIGVVAALAVGSLVVASNMGFKGRFAFTGGVAQWFSPPYNSPYKTADDLLQATCPSAGGRIQRTIASDPPGFQFWAGKGAGEGNGIPPNFVLNAGEGYEVKPSCGLVPNLCNAGGGLVEDVVLVGSHNPFIALPLSQQGLPDNADPTPDGFVANRDYLISVPWHTTHLTAEDLRTDLPGAARIIRLEETTTNVAFFFWTGPPPTGAGGNDTPQNFALTLGEAYEVRILQDTPQGVTPAHF